jgi:hypothetical protein
MHARAVGVPGGIDGEMQTLNLMLEWSIVRAQQ